MKKITFLTLLIIGCNCLSIGQCNVTTKEADDGAIHYTAQKEKVYMDDRFESGILFASLQLEVWQHPTRTNLLQFYLYAWVFIRGNKPLVVPRRIKITFSDNSFLELIAETVQDPRDLQGAAVYICEYNINMDKFLQLQKKSVSQIIITDNRSGESLTCNSYPDLLREQATCIAIRLKE